MAKAFIGLGSNLGDRNHYLDFAIECLDILEGVSVTKASNIIETPPLSGGPAQGNYLNQVLCLETSMSAADLLKKIQDIEDKGGRKRSVRWGPRTIDIDILFYEDEIINTEVLTVPHSEICKREFVLLSLVELEPLFIHPVLKKSVTELLADYYLNNGQRELEVS